MGSFRTSRTLTVSPSSKAFPVRPVLNLRRDPTAKLIGLAVDCVRMASEMDMLTTPYAFNPDEGAAMTRAGADIVVAHMGCTSGGSIGAKSVKTLATCVKLIQDIVDACKAVRPDVICLCHGGPIAMPRDAKYILDRVAGVDGFYGASSTERLPTEIAIRKQIERFKAIRLRKRRRK